MILDTDVGYKMAIINEESADQKTTIACTPILATVEYVTLFVDIVTAICTLITSLLVRTTKALCRLLCLANATPA